MKGSFADILKNLAMEDASRMEGKVPEWASVPGIVWPSRLSSEQCSSSETALHKARIAAAITGPQGRIADLTGGLGVDSWAFSQTAGQVLYNERDTALFQAAQHNFALLGVSNVTFRNEELKPGSAASLLGEFRPDLIFLDPARRDGAGKKVFLLENCCASLREALKAKQRRFLKAALHAWNSSLQMNAPAPALLLNPMKSTNGSMYQAAPL